MTATVFLLSWQACVLLCLAMPRHCMDMLPGRRLNRLQQRGLQLLAALALLSAPVLAIQADGPGIGLACWLGILSLVIMAQALLLAWRPKWSLWGLAGSLPLLTVVQF
ncbi:MAG: DUF3325 domain-containing protein [Marinobacterium sp.]|nr:DUF3325 domain-containing protein [Marinobacterium sp.]